MTRTSAELEARLHRFIEHHVLHGEHLPVDRLCDDRPDLREPLRALIAGYVSLTAALDPLDAESDSPRQPSASLPVFEGFQTIERIGRGGMGEVFKLRDLRLGRVVAAKVVRRDRTAGLDAFLREARALALFSDRRIVQIHEYRPDAQPPVIIMEYVEGFELGRIAPSLEYAQRARILVEICEAIHHAHTLGLQHRDLKPSNIMLDTQLAPRILDFGLSASEPTRGHFAGTLPYVAPEQLDRARPIDARTDVYSLGVILYELVCGRPPFQGDEGALLRGIREGTPTLPIEVAPSAPEPLQAIALTAMERDPARRYQSARDMAQDLRRYLGGQPVVARPSVYLSTLAARVHPHLQDLDEWLRLRLIHPHEAERLESAYRALDAREDDWILESRALSFVQIALYLGAFLLVCGSLFYFVAARWHGAVSGVLRPFLVLAIPFLGLNAAAWRLHRSDHKAVAIAFYLAAVVLLPLFLLILFNETQLLVAAPGARDQLFGGALSNRQLQVTTLLACAWCGALAMRTRTAALSTVFACLAFALTTAIAAEFGLRSAIDEQRWDLVALRFMPLVAAYALAGHMAERARWPWFSRPAYLASAVLFVVVFEMLALDGRGLHHLGGFSLSPWQSKAITDPTLLDTVAAMTINGALFYGAGSLLVRRGSDQTRAAAHLLFVIAPFALLHPLGFLVGTGEYSPRFDWVYAITALAIALLSQRRQRRSFYYAGVLNLGLALFYIASHREWFDRPAWAIAVIAAGLVALTTGFLLDRRSRRRQ